MRVEGKILRDQLNEYPLGTRFLCVGHWDESTYYRRNKIYTLVINKGFDERNYRILAILNPYGGWDHWGNGYSGIWELAEPLENKKLEDYL